jgi:hypothetical protein
MPLRKLKNDPERLERPNASSSERATDFGHACFEFAFLDISIDSTCQSLDLVGATRCKSNDRLDFTSARSNRLERRGGNLGSSERSFQVF